MKLSYLDLTTTDPAWNLAVEEYVFSQLPRDRMYLMLWQNHNAVIIGKHQNSLAQIDRDYVDAHGIQVVRRLSGGGAVYHDMGNLNYTIIADAHGDALDFGRFCDMVIRALEKVGVTAERNGRNDMTIDGKKFSGNAQYMKQGRIMHHGTILFDSNASVLAGALRVDADKIRSKGVDSVRSRVTNVRPYLPEDMPLNTFRQVLLNSILEQFPGEEYVFSPEDLAGIEALRQTRYATWEWNYGQNPACTLMKSRRVEGCGTVEAYLDVAQGILRKITFRGDFFSASDPALLAEQLTGCRADRESCRQALQNTAISSYFMGLDLETFLDILWG